MLKTIKNNVFARNSLVLIAGTLAANFLNYIFHLVIGRMVSIETYGEIESLISLIHIISVPAITLGMVATQYSAQCKADDDKRKNFLIIKYLYKKIFKFAGPVFLVTLLVTPFVSRFFKIENNFVFIIIWFLMLLSFFNSVNSGVATGWQKFGAVNKISIFGTLIKLFFGFLLVKIGFELNGAIGSFALAAIASYVVSVFVLKFIIVENKNSKEISNDIEALSIKKYIIPVFIGNLAINILGNADMVLAKHNLDFDEAGFYGSLSVASKIIFYATGAIGTVLFAMSASDNHQKKDSLAVLKNALVLMGIFSLGAVVAYFLVPKLILFLLFGNKYLGVANYLGWFSVLAILFSFINLFFQYLLSIKKVTVVYWLLAISVISSLVILFFGREIYAILIIMIFAQIVAGLFCVYFLFKRSETLENNG